MLAYHSLEDRIVKERFTDWSRTEEPGPVRRRISRRARQADRQALLTRRARCRPTPRSKRTRARQSARLRAVERLGS